jgi:hypothetical protein
VELYLHSPNTPPWRGAQFKHRDNFTFTFNNKHWLRSNRKGYGGKTRYTGSQNSNTTATSGRELYYLQFWLYVASPETFGYTLVHSVGSGMRDVKGGGLFPFFPNDYSLN